MPVYDFVCTNSECAVVTEKIVGRTATETITCPACGSLAQKPEYGFVVGSKRHVGIYFNYMNMDD